MPANSEHAALRIGVIGCGSISRRHLQASTDVSEVEITALSSRSKAALDEVSGDYGISSKFNDWRELVRSDVVDAVLICLPDNLHATVTIEAVRWGKHVLVEKPMSCNLAECESMIRASDEAGVVLMVAQSTRQEDSHRRAKSMIQEGRIGAVNNVVRRRLGNIIDTVTDKPWFADPAQCRDLLLYGLGSHEYDALLWLFESEAQEVVATGQRRPEIWPGWIAIDSSMMLRNGIVCTVLLSAKSDENHWDTQIEGTEGSMTIYGDRLTVSGQDVDTPRDVVASFAAQLREFAHGVRTGQPGPFGENVHATMAVLEGLHESLQSGLPLQLVELGVRWSR
jgi:predicted dehydrogenase